MATRGAENRGWRFCFMGVFLLIMGQALETKSVTVLWDPNPENDIAGYRLFWGETNSAATVRDVGNVTQTQVTNLVAGRTYYFYLTAYNTSGLESDPSTNVFYTQPQSVPATPSGFSGTAVSSTQISLRWTDNSSNETGFHLMRKAGSGGIYTTITLGANATTYTDSGLTAGTQYFYKINAFNSSGNSTDSAEISVTTPPQPVSVATSASFVRPDSTTSGAWRGRYGLQGGFAYPYGSFAPPSYVQINAWQNYPLTWATSTTDPRALQKLSGTDRFAAAWHWTNFVVFYLRFKDTAVHQVSFYFLDFDRQGRQQKIEFIDIDTGRLLAFDTITNFENGVYSTWDLQGNVAVRITRVAGPDCVLSALFFDGVATGSASFIGSDGTTSGSWRGTYGTEGGLAYPYGILTPPAYVQLNAWQNYPLLWSSSTTDSRALQKPSGTDRFAGAWNSTNWLYFYVRFKDTATHEVSLYFLDYERLGRVQKLEVFDDGTGNLLASTTISNFQNGVYYSWNFSGNVRVKVTAVSGPNCVLSAIFFDPPGPNSAEFIAADTTTAGTWKGVYGSAGQTIAGETPSLPSYASVTFSGASPWIWNSSTTDPAALQRSVQTGRIASAWYNDTARQYIATIDLSDNATHEVSLYFVDFDNLGREEVVEILDAQTGASLDSTQLTNFRSGVWLRYDVSGTILVRITSLKSSSAVLSGIFFD
jgi:hypothetical protein